MCDPNGTGYGMTMTMTGVSDFNIPGIGTDLIPYQPNYTPDCIELTGHNQYGGGKIKKKSLKKSRKKSRKTKKKIKRTVKKKKISSKKSKNRRKTKAKMFRAMSQMAIESYSSLKGDKSKLLKLHESFIQDIMKHSKMSIGQLSHISHLRRFFKDKNHCKKILKEYNKHYNQIFKATLSDKSYNGMETLLHIYEEILSQKELKSVQSKLDSIVKKRKRNTVLEDIQEEEEDFELEGVSKKSIGELMCQFTLSAIEMQKHIDKLNARGLKEDSSEYVSGLEKQSSDYVSDLSSIAEDLYSQVPTYKELTSKKEKKKSPKLRLDSLTASDIQDGRDFGREI